MLFSFLRFGGIFKPFLFIGWYKIFCGEGYLIKTIRMLSINKRRFIYVVMAF